MKISNFGGYTRFALSAALTGAFLLACSRPQSHAPAARTSLSFKGEVFLATNILLPSLDHRVVIIEAKVRNDGSIGSRLHDWLVTGHDAESGQTIDGIIMPPSGIRYVGNSTAGVSLNTPYNAKTFLPNLGDAPLRPGASIDGLLQVKFPRAGLIYSRASRRVTLSLSKGDVTCMRRCIVVQFSHEHERAVVVSRNGF
jgi:hypothetical protein